MHAHILCTNKEQYIILLTTYSELFFSHVVIVVK